MISKRSSFQVKRLALSVAAALSLSAGVMASESEMKFNLKKQELGSALLAVSQQSGVQIALPAVVSSHKAHVELNGAYTLTEALQNLLAGTGLTYKFSSENLIVIQSKAGEGESEGKVEARDDVEEIVVTGSRLERNPGKLTKQMDFFTRDEIEKSGVESLFEFLERLPQNINAPTNIGASTTMGSTSRDFGESYNVFAGSSVNLRGLGAQYTLVLIDGRRPAKGGMFGGIFDISDIPIERVERIEILYDGAAAMYGADAIGGVVNIITNRDFQDQTNVSVGWSSTRGGGGGRYKLNVGRTFGWETGSATVSVDLQKQFELEGNERDIEFTSPNSFRQADDDFILYPSAEGTPANVGTGFGNDYYLMGVADLNGDGDTMDDGERITTGVRSEYQGRPQLTPGATSQLPDGFIPVFTLQLPETWADPEQMTLYDVVEDSSAPLPEFAGQWDSLSDEQQAEYTAMMRARFPVGGNAYQVGQGYSLVPEEDVRGVSLKLNQELTDGLDMFFGYSYTVSDKFMKTANDVHTDFVSSNLDNVFDTALYLSYSDALPQQLQDIQVKNEKIDFGITWDINSDWRLDFGASSSERDSWAEQQNDYDSSLFTYSGGGAGLSYGYAYDRIRGANPDWGNSYYWPTSDYVDANPFDPNNFGFESMEAYEAAFLDDFYTKTVVTSKDYDLNLRGVLAQLPAGPLRANFALSGLERTNSTATQVLNDKNLWQSGVWDTTSEAYLAGLRFDDSWGSKRQSAAVELSAPVTDTFLLNGVMRKEQFDHSSLKDANMWSFGFNWSVADWVTVRFNRNYGESAPNSLLYRDRGSYATTTTKYLVDEDGVRLSPSVRMEYYNLYGAAADLHMEGNFTNTLGATFDLTDEVELKLNLTDGKTMDMVRKAYINTPSMLHEFTEEYADANEYLDIIPEDGMYPDLPINEDGVTVDNNGDPLVPGQFIVDQRYFNSGTAHTRTLDAMLSFRGDTDYGYINASLGYQYYLKYDITDYMPCSRTELLEGNYGIDLGEFGNCEVNQLQTFGKIGSLDNFDSTAITGRPVPEHTLRFNLSWTYRGLTATAYTRYTSDTSLIKSSYKSVYLGRVDGVSQYDRFVNIYEVTTKEARRLDLNFTYDFGSGDLFSAPAWLKGSQLSLRISNAFDGTSKVSRKMLREEYDPGEFAGYSFFSPYGIDPRGRAYSINLRTKF